VNKTKKIIRNLIIPTILKLNIEKIILKQAKNSCCIINFHGVKKNNTPSINNRHISIEEFDKTIKYLSVNFNVVPLSYAFEIHRKEKKIRNKTIAITFDDGYKNNFENALPILKKYNTPATFYLITKCLEDSQYKAWPDLYELILFNHKETIEVNGLKFLKGTLYNKEKQIFLVNYLKTLGNKTDSIVSEIINNYKINTIIPKEKNELFELITKEELISFKNERILEFGSHTHSHPCLEYLNEVETELELLNSKNLLEQTLGKKINSLAFPDGSYNMKTIEIAKKIGFSNLVAVDYKYRENNSNSNLLSRFTISNSTTNESNIFRLSREFDKYGF